MKRKEAWRVYDALLVISLTLDLLRYSIYIVHRTRNRIPFDDFIFSYIFSGLNFSVLQVNVCMICWRFSLVCYLHQPDQFWGAMEKLWQLCLVRLTILSLNCLVPCNQICWVVFVTTNVSFTCNLSVSRIILATYIHHTVSSSTCTTWTS